MMLPSFLFLALGALAVQAAVIAPRASTCVKKYSGYLAANATGQLHSFTTLSDGKVGYTGDGKKPLIVEFQWCGADTPSPVGRLYVPSTKKCVSVTNQQSTTAPYYPVVASCVLQGSAGFPSDAQAWASGTKGGLNIVRWSGMTDEEGSTPQGGCGQFGYKSHSKGVPTLTSSGQVQLECYETSTPFYLSPNAV